MNNPLRSIAILVGVVSTLTSGAVAAPPATTFEIVNSGSGLCLERNGDGWGERPLQQPCNNSDAQKWGASRATQSATTTRYLIIGHLSPNLCLDVRGGVDADRTVVQQWDCEIRAPSMRWQFSTLVPDRFFKLISEIGSRCLDVAGGSLQPGAPIQIYSCSGDNTNTAQIWETRVVQ